MFVNSQFMYNFATENDKETYVIDEQLLVVALLRITKHREKIATYPRGETYVKGLSFLRQAFNIFNWTIYNL